MAIQFTATQSDIQTKVVNSYGTAITRTFSGLLPVGTAAQQGSGDAIYTNPEAAEVEVDYNPLQKEKYQTDLKATFYGENPQNGVVDMFTGYYALLLNWTAGGVSVNRYYTNKSDKTEIEVN